MPISFAASNEQLARANEAFYRGPATAPEYVLCALYSGLGQRAGIQDDAPALQALLDNYHPDLVEHGMLLLQKNQQAWKG
jgi:hypothetical protein